MIIGCVKEIKEQEYRVAIPPCVVSTLLKLGHSVLIESQAGAGSGFSDAEYKEHGANICSNEEAWKKSDLIVKVKEPLLSEWDKMRAGQTLFTFLHLAADKKLTQALLEKRIIGIAYETIEQDKMLPLLRPMSEIAGKMAVQQGAWCLEKTQGGKGVLPGAALGLEPACVVIVGAGVVGTSAARVAMGMGARVIVLDTNVQKLERIENLFGERVQTWFASPANLEKACMQADLLIGAVLSAGAKAPQVISRELIKKMQKGSVIVDVSIDQGGCVEGIRATNYKDPFYVEDGILHYAVTNIPGAVPKTSTMALSNATLPYLLELANNGIEKAIKNNIALQKGLNVYQGDLTNEAVALAHKMNFTPYKHNEFPNNIRFHI